MAVEDLFLREGGLHGSVTEYNQGQHDGLVSRDERYPYVNKDEEKAKSNLRLKDVSSGAGLPCLLGTLTHMPNNRPYYSCLLSDLAFEW